MRPGGDSGHRRNGQPQILRRVAPQDDKPYRTYAHLNGAVLTFVRHDTDMEIQRPPDEGRPL